MNTANDWARIFKLHACIDNPRFAEQVHRIQADAILNELLTNDKKKAMMKKEKTNLTRH